MEFISTFERVRDFDLIFEFAKTLAGKRVLDVGCGGGNELYYLLKRDAMLLL